MSETIDYNQNLYNADMQVLATQIKASGSEYAYVVGLARGGLIPAVQLSHMLDVPFDSLLWQTRDGGIQERKRELLVALHEGKKILIVDDLIDSGHAMSSLIEDLGFSRAQLDIAVLYYNTAQSIKPDYYARTIDRSVDERWIVFWWEQNGTTNEA